MHPTFASTLLGAAVLSMPHIPLPIEDYWPLVQPLLADAIEEPHADPVLIALLLAAAYVWSTLMAVVVMRRLERRRRRRAPAARVATH
jgi:hypothetical protein